MKRNDITRIGKDRADGLDMFSVEGVRLNTPRLSIPQDESNASIPAAQDFATAAADAPARAPDADAAPSVPEGSDGTTAALTSGLDGDIDAAGASDTAGSSGGASGAGAKVTPGDTQVKKETQGDDVTIHLRGADVKWRSQMRRNPITGEGMETEEYAAAAKKKTFRDC